MNHRIALKLFPKAAALLLACATFTSAQEAPKPKEPAPQPRRPVIDVTPVAPGGQRGNPLTVVGSRPNAPRTITNASRLRPPATNAFEFVEGDRVALLGDTLIEREQTYGYIEHRLSTEFPDRKLTFRNLAWSADTPVGQSRVSFDWNKGEEEWFRQLKEQIATFKPTVAILGYGMAASFEGAAGLEKFKKDMNRLMDAIQETSKDKPVRFIILSPIRHEKLPKPLPDPAQHNEALALYTKALRALAEQRNARFISLFDSLPDGTTVNPPIPLTDNGVHLNAFGYYRAAEVIARGLGWYPGFWQISILGKGEIRDGSMGALISDIQKTPASVQYTLLPDKLDMPPLPAPGNARRGTSPTVLQFLDIANGAYSLKIDGEQVVTLPFSAWKSGGTVTNGAPFDRAEKLRQTIVKKNELFFHRWRPQNQTYLFGFRKHEQGQNAREIPQFDPLVAELEEQIAALRKPAAHKIELVPSASANAPEAAPAPPAATPKPQSSPSSSSDSVSARPMPRFDLAEGFEINLFAENPLLAKPIQMNFDPQGRLWIASSEVYPQIKPGQTATDKIIIVEDTDGDGKAEKSTVFADGLLIPTGVEPGDGGVYVGASTELLFFKDTDGDGKADQKRVVLSGFGTEDTHHILHTLRWSHDGQLYFNQSIYIHSHIETPHGVVRLNSGGVWRFRTPTQELGVFVRGFCNPWGHHFDAYGQSFITDGAGGQGLSWGIEGATYFTYADMRRELRSVSPGAYPKFCGIEIVESEHFPADWQGNAITPDFRAHRLVRFAINDAGSGYVTKEMPDLLRSPDVTFRPIDVKLGPDGALYVADWSNPIIQHGEVDFRDPRRDKEMGRIWRISAKGRPLNARKDFTNLSNTDLLGQLSSPNNYDRQRARRVLTERGPEKIQSDLAALAQARADEKSSLEALWMFQSIDVVEPALLERLLAAKDGRVRAAATRVLRYWHPRLNNASDLLAKLVVDEHPRVRVEALRALAQLPSVRSAELVLSAVALPMDDFVEYAAWLSINDLAQPWIDAVQSGAWKIEGREKQLEYALQAIQPRLGAPVLARLLESRPLPRDGSGPWIDLIGKAGSEKELRLLLDAVLQKKLDDSATARALASLGHASRVRKLKPGGELSAVSAALASHHEETRASAAQLAGAWKLAALTPNLLTLAKDASPRVRQAAFDGLRETGGPEVLASVQKLAAKDNDLATRQLAAQTAASLDLGKASPAVIEVLNDLKDEVAALAMWRSLLGNKGAAKPLARALPKEGFSTAAAKAGMRAAREGGRSEPELVLALARAGGLEDESKNLTAAEIQQMAASVKQQGDPARGELIYRRADLACMTCHAIGGVGGKVGPDMTSIGASAPVDYLIESLLYPNRKIKEGFHSVLLETKDGQEMSGVVVRENGDQVVLRDAANREVSVPKGDIARRTQSGSLMPSGLLDALSTAEQIDLYRFLSELGKPGPYDASKGSVARLWRVRPALHTIEQFGEEKILTGDFTSQEWKPLNAFVDGRVTPDALKDAMQVSRWYGLMGLYAAAKFQVPKEGPVRLQLTGAPFLSVWVNGQPAKEFNGSEGQPLRELTTSLPAGTHTLVVKLDPKRIPEFLKAQTSDATFLTN